MILSILKEYIIRVKVLNPQPKFLFSFLLAPSVFFGLPCVFVITENQATVYRSSEHLFPYIFGGRIQAGKYNYYEAVLKALDSG